MNGRQAREELLRVALEFLGQHNEVAFATCEGGEPRLRQFQIMRQEGATLFFATSAQKEVYRQLCDNPAVELLASADKVSVRCAGRVDFEVDDATRRWVYDNNPVLPRLYSSYDKLAYFKLNVRRLDYYDLRPTPPILLHFDLEAETVGGGFVGERFGNYSPMA